MTFCRFVFPVICLVAVGLPQPTQAAESEEATFARTVAPVLKRYCVECHHGEKPKGGLSLDALTEDLGKQGKQWQAVQERLTDRTMPPKGRPQPSSAERQAVVEWVSDGLKVRRATQGRALLRRLNRVEYSHAIRDLLGIDQDLIDLLPEDGKASGFDNVDVALDLSSTLLERYFDAAEVALDAALVTGPRPTSVKKRVDLSAVCRALIAQNKRPLFEDAQTLDDCLLYDKDPPSGPKVIRDLQVPTAGRYRFRISASTRSDEEQRVAMRVYAGYGDSHRSWLVNVFDVGEQPAVIEFTECLQRRDSVNISVSGVTHRWHLPKDSHGPGLAVYWVEVEGPLSDPWPPASLTRLLGDIDPDKGTLADAEAILRRFTRRAYRRPVTNTDIEPLMGLVRSRLDRGGKFLDGLRVALSAVLCGPDFLYIRSSPRLDDFELATRLSFFLWSSTPDDILLDLAAESRLSKPDVLRAQVERLLADPKAHSFTEDFTGQWLNLRALSATNPDPRLYPEFDALLEWSLPQETHLFFEEILREDRSVVDFVQSDWTILNGRLAEHYGIPGVKKQYFRKVALPAGSHRGGVLTQASILKVTANGTSTSPVIRGVWVLDRILGKPAAPPPPNVPAVEPDIRGATSIREQLARHRSVGTCATCHERIDPPGFALESFDPIGGWRERYRVTPSDKYRAKKTFDGSPVAYADGLPVECGDELPNGKKFTDIDSFKRLLLDDKEQIARALAARLLIYATGHGLEPGDQATVDALVAAIRKKNYGLRSLVHELVQSDAFRSK